METQPQGWDSQVTWDYINKAVTCQFLRRRSYLQICVLCRSLNLIGRQSGLYTNLHIISWEWKQYTGVSLFFIDFFFARFFIGTPIRTHLSWTWEYTHIKNNDHSPLVPLWTQPANSPPKQWSHINNKLFSD